MPSRRPTSSRPCLPRADRVDGCDGVAANTIDRRPERPANGARPVRWSQRVPATSCVSVERIRWGAEDLDIVLGCDPGDLLGIDLRRVG